MTDSGAFVLMVSNQSFVLNPVDIEARIDDRIVVQDEFDVTGPQRRSTTGRASASTCPEWF
jgi:hypothetical protein